MRAPMFPSPTKPTFSDLLAVELDIHFESDFVRLALFVSACKCHFVITVENCLYAIFFLFCLILSFFHSFPVIITN